MASFSFFWVCLNFLASFILSDSVVSLVELCVLGGSVASSGEMRSCVPVVCCWRLPRSYLVSCVCRVPFTTPPCGIFLAKQGPVRGPWQGGALEVSGACLGCCPPGAPLQLMSLCRLGPPAPGCWSQPRVRTAASQGSSQGGVLEHPLFSPSCSHAALSQHTWLSGLGQVAICLLENLTSGKLPVFPYPQ